MATKLREGREEDQGWILDSLCTVRSYKAFLCSEAALILMEDLLGYIGVVSQQLRTDLLSQILWVYDTYMSYIIYYTYLVTYIFCICSCVFSS